MLAIISPSKAQNFTPTDTNLHSQLRQLTDSQELIKLLKTKTEPELADLMSISQKLAKLNVSRFQTFTTPLTLHNAKQALLAFSGGVYNGIDAGSFSPQDLAFAQNNLRMLSGLYGVIRPLDLIKPYRLEMGTRLKTNRGNNLYQFWGNKISKILNQDEPNEIINLASSEYFKSVQQASLKANIINIAFKENKNGVYKIIGIHAKRARGLMVNFIVKNKIDRPQSLQSFSVEGYQFKADFSDDKLWVFAR